MKRRTLKKKVNYICSELFAECIAMSSYQLVANRDDADNVMFDILSFHDEMISRLSHVQPGNVKGFFCKYKEDMKASIEELTTRLQNLL